MNKYAKILMGGMVCLIFASNARAEPIYHEKYYPDGSGPFPAVIALHSSGGFKTVKHLIQRYVDDGFAVYAPDFFKRHGLTSRTRMKTFSTYRENIEEELTEIVDLMKNEPKINNKNIFAVGFSNGGFWVCYLTGTSKVNAGVSHFGVWKANMGRELTNPYPMRYFSKSSSPILALHGEEDGTQRMEFVEESWDEVKDRGGRLETHVYSDTDHAWNNKKRNKGRDYNEEVDKDSHKRTIEFFRKNMK
jgi:dienelactone hydrolase